MELGELRVQVVEAAVKRLAMLTPDDLDHLFAEQPNVLGECIHLLERTVVQVESESNEQPLVRRGQTRFARIGPKRGSWPTGSRPIGLSARPRGPTDARIEPLLFGSRPRASDRGCVGRLDGLLADPQLATDLSIGQAACHRLEHDALTLAELDRDRSNRRSAVPLCPRPRRDGPKGHFGAPPGDPRARSS